MIIIKNFHARAHACFFQNWRLEALDCVKTLIHAPLLSWALGHRMRFMPGLGVGATDGALQFYLGGGCTDQALFGGVL